MPIPFGVGVGDCIAAGGLIRKVVQELKKVSPSVIKAPKLMFISRIARHLRSINNYSSIWKHFLVPCHSYRSSSLAPMSLCALNQYELWREAVKFHWLNSSRRLKSSKPVLEHGLPEPEALLRFRDECSGG